MSPLVGFLNSYFSWRASYIFLGVLVWILAVPITFFVMRGSPQEMGLQPDGMQNGEPGGSPENGSGDQHMTPSPSEEGWPLKQAISTPTFWWVAITYLLAPMAQGGVLQHQVPIILEAGLAPTLAATALGITAGMGGFGKLGFGRLSELLPFQVAATLCFGLQALSIFLLLTSHSAIMIWIYVFLYGFAMGGVIVLLPLVVGHFFGLASFGSLVGIVTFIQSVGSASGAYLSGVLYDWQGNYHLGLILFASIYLAAIVTIFLAGKPKVYME
jgi:sugar phosphate permease